MGSRRTGPARHLRRGAQGLLAIGLAACSDGAGPNAAAMAGAAPELNVRFTIDSSVARHPISPYIYGANQANWTGRQRFLRLGRIGGNRLTAYNWETNASNAGSDYRHQNDSYLGGGDVPGEAVRPYIAAAHAAGAAVIVTVPMAGYVSADKAPDGDVNQTPDYLNTRFLRSVAGKGRAYRFPPDTADGVVYQDEFVARLESTFPYARQDPTRTLFYCLDNEPDLWAFTHARLRPTGKVSYEELTARTLEWSQAIKSAAPGALVFGPVSYGWAGFTRLQEAADATGRDFLDHYLATLRAAEPRHGRLLDVLDLHWYPEARGGGVRVTEPSSTPAVAAARVQAPRSLWDPSYVEQSWISVDAGVGAIRLLPRMRDKIAAHYPGTRLAITEYDYGGGNDISGGLAQADVLGIFGREDLFAAARWGDSQPFVDAAFDAFTNFDGGGARFGAVSVSAQNSHPAETSVYASVDPGRDDRVVVVAINKSTGATVAEIAISHPVELTQGRTFQLTAARASLVPAAPLTQVSRNSFRLTMPPSSVTTILLTRF